MKVWRQNFTIIHFFFFTIFRKVSQTWIFNIGKVLWHFTWNFNIGKVLWHFTRNFMKFSDIFHKISIEISFKISIETSLMTALPISQEVKNKPASISLLLSIMPCALLIYRIISYLVTPTNVYYIFPNISIMLQNRVISYCICGERAPSVVRPAKPGFVFCHYLNLICPWARSTLLWLTQLQAHYVTYVSILIYLATIRFAHHS